MSDNDTAVTAMQVRPRVCLQGVFSAAGTIACVATVLGFLGRVHWFLDLFSHFRVQYLAGLAVLGILCLLARQRRTAAVFMAFAVVNLVVIAPLYIGPGPVAPRPGAEQVRVMLINVHTANGHSGRVQAAIEAAAPDIVVLEEVSRRWMNELTGLTNAYPHGIAEPREDNFGIALYSRRPLTQARVAYIGTAEVPSILATVPLGGTGLYVVATHPLPPAGRAYTELRNEQLDLLVPFVRSPLPTVLVGDLNTTPWNHRFRRLLERTGLRDSAQGRGVHPSWPTHDPLVRIPLDHCLHSPDLVVLDRRVGPHVGSDHFPLVVDLAPAAAQ